MNKLKNRASCFDMIWSNTSYKLSQWNLLTSTAWGYLMNIKTYWTLRKKKLCQTKRITREVSKFYRSRRRPPCENKNNIEFWIYFLVSSLTMEHCSINTSARHESPQPTKQKSINWTSTREEGKHIFLKMAQGNRISAFVLSSILVLSFLLIISMAESRILGSKYFR
jgi:hypothetical protein